MRKLSNRVISCLLCLICMLPLSPVQVFAAGAIDVNKAVHLKIQYIHDKTPVSDVPFDLYYVASVDAYRQGACRSPPAAMSRRTSVFCPCRCI